MLIFVGLMRAASRLDGGLDSGLDEGLAVGTAAGSVGGAVSCDASEGEGRNVRGRFVRRLRGGGEEPAGSCLSMRPRTP